MSDKSFLNKEWCDMTDGELQGSFDYWSACVEDAAGWPSAYTAAKYLAGCVREGCRRGLKMTNPYPIKVG